MRPQPPIKASTVRSPTFIIFASHQFATLAACVCFRPIADISRLGLLWAPCGHICGNRAEGEMGSWYHFKGTASRAQAMRAPLFPAGSVRSSSTPA
jgi:hypothetical protein